ncbi:hypothetical protein LTR94_000274 [Friedmanniomyces endolithicus]|nr:hypothetical protein LTR94_000274 [Friedmanniomyces endolithicus]
MVSHHHLPTFSDFPSPAPTAPPGVPRAASVTSGRSHTRRHRHARTHHGGSSSTYTPQNEFPVFSHTGDIEIIITSANGRAENRYLLHRLILSQCSGFFEAGTRAEWSGQPSQSLARINENESVTVGGSSRASSQERRPAQDLQPKQRWRYMLDWQNTGDDGPPMLVSVPAKSGDEVLKDYDNLFRTMYQYPPILDSINIATAYTECKALLHLADMYDALEIVGSRVDHHLLRFGARLFKQIAKYPSSYLKLGYLARSRTIFIEALIHVVGQWPLAASQLKGQMDAPVMDLIEDKVDELQEQQEKVEFKLWRLALTTSRGERVTPANDYLAWLGISLFRQWLAENTTPAPASLATEPSRPGTGTTAPPGRATSRSNSSNHIASQRTQPPPPPPSAPAPPAQGKVYRLLGSSSTNPTAYLTHDELKRFLKLQPELYTRDNLRRFERRIDDIKALAREAVKPLMRNYLELDLSTFGTAGLGYLTCVRLEEEELPWED